MSNFSPFFQRDFLRFLSAPVEVLREPAGRPGDPPLKGGVEVGGGTNVK